MRTILKAMTLVLALCTPTLGHDASPYANARFGYGMMRLDYAASERTRYDDVVLPLVKSFYRSTCR